MKITELLNTVAGNENSALFFTPPYYKGEKCYLFTSPELILQVRDRKEYDDVFNKVESLKKSFIIVALLNYEAGFLFEEKFNKFLQNYTGEVLITLLCYKKADCRILNNQDILYPEQSELLEMPEYQISNFVFNTTYREYAKAITKIKNHIYEGDTYQVNYTIKGKFDFSGSWGKLFLNLIANQSTRYSALINLKDKVIISVSPELFFELDEERIITKPMKGTIERGINSFDDGRLKSILHNSEKDKAENVMIVDLLRNDFGRIAEFGSVKVESLYDIEKYESVFQMTSTIEAKVKNKEMGMILENVFPCGSITGAPKIRTMEIINELEKEPRGIYTGAIGIIENNKAKFNVAIRTLVIKKQCGKGEIGLGGGIVWDSVAEKEYNEIHIKGLFLTRQDMPFQLIETILWENGEFFLLIEHIERLKITSGFFLFNFNEELIKSGLEKRAKDFSFGCKYKIRLLLNKEGKIKIIADELLNQTSQVKVLLSNRKIISKNKFQYFKTTNRKLYDEEYKSTLEKGFFDLIFLNESDLISEGAISNIIIQKDGIWYTPEIEQGILAGCYRNYFMKNHSVIEKELSINELLSADKIILVNSVRKEVPVTEIWNNMGIVWEQKSLKL